MLKLFGNRKGKGDNGWLMVAIIAAALLIPQSPFYLGSTVFLQPPVQWLTNYNGEVRLDYGDSWIDDYPVPLSTSAGTFKVFDYEVVQQKTGGERTETIYGTPYCQPNNCNGIVSGTDAGGCNLYLGTTTVVSQFTETSSGVNCQASASARYTCLSLTTSLVSCTGPSGCDLANHREPGTCYQNIAGAGMCTGTCQANCVVEATCGGLRGDVIGTETGKGCWSQSTIYKDGIEINKTRWTMGGTRYNFDDVTLSLRSGAKASETRNDCWRVENTVVFHLPKDSFELNVTPSSRQVFETEQVKASVVVDNRWRRKAVQTYCIGGGDCPQLFEGKGMTAYGNLIVTFKIPTAIGIKEATVSRIVNLSVGKSSHDFDVPTTLVTNEVEVTVSMDVLMPGVSFQGFNGICYKYPPNPNVIPYSLEYWMQYKDTDLGGCAHVKIGSFPAETFKVQINPKPLYISDRGNCTSAPNAISGYECQPTSGLYVRSDVKSLTCVQIGCPVTPDKTYQCTSAGICAETVYIYQDCNSKPCPSGTTCDAPSGACIKTEIFEKVVQCSRGSDCFKPCNGVFPSCSNNRCSYSGQCDITSVQCLQNSDCPLTPCAGVTSSCSNNRCQFVGSCNPIYLNLSCATEGCPTSYSCDNTFSPPVCKKTDVINLDCSTLGCPRDYSCLNTTLSYGQSTSFVCSKTNTIYVDIDCRSVGKSCPAGYSCISAGINNGLEAGLCKKTDLVKQDCVQLGCPSGYACSLDGTCLKSQTTYIVQDCNSKPCPSDYLCQKESGLCIKSERIFDSCKTLGCPKDYSCTDEVCVKTEFVNITTVLDKNPVFGKPRSMSTTALIILGAIVVGAIALAARKK